MIHNKMRKFLKRLLSVQPINYCSVRIIKALIASHLPFPFKRKIHRFPLPDVSKPFEIRISPDLILKFMNPGQSSIENLLYLFGTKGYEPEMIPIISSLAAEIACFMDIGSNNGYYSLIVSALNKDCNVFAFEPSPINIEWCRRNIVANGFSNCRLIPMAVSNYTGITRLFGYDQDSRPTIFDNGHNTDRQTFIEVDVITIDDFIEKENLTNVDLVKIDVELAEPEVLEGMKKCMKTHSPILICEVLHAADVHKIRDILNETGYRAYHIGSQGRLKHDDSLDRTGTGEMRNFLLTKMPLSDIGLSKFEIDN